MSARQQHTRIQCNNAQNAAAAAAKPRKAIFARAVSLRAHAQCVGCFLELASPVQQGGAIPSPQAAAADTAVLRRRNTKQKPQRQTATAHAQAAAGAREGGGSTRLTNCARRPNMVKWVAILGGLAGGCCSPGSGSA
eukprot:3171070-Rhodomonas_salina.1